MQKLGTVGIKSLKGFHSKQPSYTTFMLESRIHGVKQIPALEIQHTKSAWIRLSNR